MIYRRFMNITYDYYRIFYYVVKFGSFTKAAEALDNSQPNITRAMIWNHSLEYRCFTVRERELSLQGRVKCFLKG